MSTIAQLRPIHVTALFVVGAVLLALALAPHALAASNPSGMGQPNASCEESTAAPPGFATGGFANAQAHYAGSGFTNTPANGDAVSQYDVACYQLSNTPH